MKKQVFNLSLLGIALAIFFFLLMKDNNSDNLQGNWRNEFIPHLFGINIEGIHFFSEDSVSIIYRKNLSFSYAYEIKNRNIWIFAGERKINLGKYKVSNDMLQLDLGIVFDRDPSQLRDTFQLVGIPTSATVNLHTMNAKGNIVLSLWKSPTNTLYASISNFYFPVLGNFHHFDGLISFSRKKTIGNRIYILVGNQVTLRDITEFYASLLFSGYNDDKELILVLNTDGQGDYNILFDEINQLWAEDFSKIIPDKPKPALWGFQFYPKRSDFIKQVDSIVRVSSTEDVKKIRQLPPLKKYLISLSENLSMPDYVKAQETCQFLRQNGRIIKTEIRLE